MKAIHNACLVILFTVFFNSPIFGQVWNWAGQVAGYSTGSSGNRVDGVSVDNNENIYIVGHYGDSASLGGTKLKSLGGRDMYVAKINSSGSYVWARSFGSTSFLELALDITNDPDGNVYVCGLFGGDRDFGTIQQPHFGNSVAVAKYNSDGVVQWARQVPAMTSGPGGLVYSGNHIYAAVDRTLIKYELDGDSVWIRAIPTSAAYDIEYHDVTADVWGCIYVTGKMKGTITYGSYTLSSSSISDPDILIVKYDPNGDVMWAKRAGAAVSSPGQDDIGRRITTSQHGEVYVAGQYRGTAGFDTDTVSSGSAVSGLFVVKYDSEGNIQWVKGGSSTSTGGVSNAWGITTLANDDVLIAANYTINLTFADTTFTQGAGSDVLMLRLGADGARRWGKRSDSFSTNVLARCLDANVAKTAVYVGGHMYFTVTFGPSTLTIAGGVEDGFLAKMAISSITAVRELANAPLPESYSLSQNYPNPFNPTTTIEFKVAAASRVSVDIINMLGQRVRTLVDEDLAAGNYATEWDGVDYAGRKVASGVYLYRLQSGDYIDTRKMTLLK